MSVAAATLGVIASALISYVVTRTRWAGRQVLDLLAPLGFLSVDGQADLLVKHPERREELRRRDGPTLHEELQQVEGDRDRRPVVQGFRRREACALRPDV